ncbi:MAG: TIGR03905 family TSCPD domain-containing protein [Kiritimatiellae bacterium]|nr:TIGR03905 family TSCPD domain-containing protein [Kiritimatiellia bacterium]
MTYTYMMQGTCAKAVRFDIENGVVTRCEFAGGCAGNTQGVARLSIGRKPEELIPLLKGIQCHGGTSCPDQFARALEKVVVK